MNNKDKVILAIRVLIKAKQFTDAEIWDFAHHLLGFASWNEINEVIKLAQLEDYSGVNIFGNPCRKGAYADTTRLS